MKKILSLFLLLLWLPSPQAAAADNRFPDIAGWKRAGDIQRFSPQTLYEYINGAADLYLACDFEELLVADYGGAGKAAVTVEIYRHRTPRDAFGIYSQERLPGAGFLAVGAEGYGDKNLLNFVSGPYYVKISSFATGGDDPQILRAFATGTAERLGERGGLPPTLSLFPPEGKKERAEKYIARNFLGYPFFNGVFTADYAHPGGAFRLFLLEAQDAETAGRILAEYLRSAKSPSDRTGEGRYSVADPHHGVIELIWRGAFLGGVSELPDAGLRSDYLKRLEAKLP